MNDKDTQTKVDDAGPACSRCDVPAVAKQGHQWLCPKHYRFGQMRHLAKRRGLSVPTHQQLENLTTWLHEMRCPKCNVVMNWLARDGQATVLSLQHYRSGSMGFLCRSCNTRHAAQPGDEFMAIPSTHKRCPGCMTILHLSEFGTDRSGRFQDRKTYCFKCSSKRHKEWQEKNRDKYNAKQREYRAKRKSEGRPVRGGR